MQVTCATETGAPVHGRLPESLFIAPTTNFHDDRLWTSQPEQFLGKLLESLFQKLPCLSGVSLQTSEVTWFYDGRSHWGSGDAIPPWNQEEWEIGV